jgi:VWFA-related protein
MHRFVPPAARFAAVALAAASLAAGGQSAPAVQADRPSRPATFDMVVVDRDGRAPESLGPGDLTVTVDGKPRRILAVRRISRGPGAVSDAGARAARTGNPAGFAAEPSRNVLLVIDQAGLHRGEERAAIAAGRALLDRLGMADRLAVVLLPLSGNQMLSLTTEQPVVREALALMTGQLVPAALAQPDEPAAAPLREGVAGNPEREEAAPPAQPQAPVPSLPRGNEPARALRSLDGLAGLLQALRSLPGRKVVALFSGGVTDPSPAPFLDLAADAIAARAAIYTFGLATPRDDSQLNLQLGPLESLAKSTGGAAVSLGRNPDRTVARLAAELGTCFVVELEPGASDADGRRHALRVDLAGRAWSARAPAWLAPAPDAGDLPVDRPEPAPDAPPAAPAAADTRPARPPENPSARDIELQTALGKLLDYVEAYERQYSGLVAEEEYRQSSPGKRVRMRSDYLLVKPEHTDGWVSFRDVYEVDGVAVRDRDDRLRRLFLEPDLQARTQLEAIAEESSRYNIGGVERTVNVPLFPLAFLTPQHRPGFRFKNGGKRESAGVEVWRIDYEERGRPTVIRDLQDHDVPAKGWFLVDQATGAIVEYGVRVGDEGSAGEIVVSFRRDPALGMWVPAKMTETYQSMGAASGRGYARMQTFLEGTATYSKYRRFQVKTEEKIVIPK